MPNNPVRRLTFRKLIVLIIVFSLTSALGIVLAGYGSLDLIPSGQYVKTQANEAMSGQICPFSINFSEPFDMMLSDGVTFRLTGYDLANGFYLNKMGLLMFDNISDSQFSIHFYNQKMYVSADIRDPENNPIAQIVNNTWRTVNPSYALSYWDRNYNAYAFEVIDSKGKPTFAVAMVGPNRIRFGGLFYYNQNGSIYVGALPDGTAGVCINAGSDMHQEDNIIWTTLFKYPALTNPINVGVMKNPIYPANNPMAEADAKIQLGYDIFYSGSILTAFSLVVLPMAMAAFMEKRKKPQSVPTVVQYYTNYYYGNRQKGSRRKRKGRKR